MKTKEEIEAKREELITAMYDSSGKAKERIRADVNVLNWVLEHRNDDEGVK